MKILTLSDDTLLESNKPLLQAKEAWDVSRSKALELLEALDVRAYAKSRNSLDGATSRLSIYVEHGLLSVNDFLEHIEKTDTNDSAQALLQQLYWREFFLQTYEQDTTKIWHDYEPYKTGFCADDYADTLPQDIQEGTTNIPLIDLLVKELESTGYLHNHARLYLASYIIHFRKVKWQVGALWMLQRLNDANLAVNNLSWQWVASTRSNKPYIFNWENIEKFAAKKYKLQRQEHQLFDRSYQELEEILFQTKG